MLLLDDRREKSVTRAFVSELEQEVIADVRMKQVERETLEKLSERKNKVI